ncbi:MAG: IS200/IS605 family element transposase accessory protein TnpB [Microcystis aeruginosa LG13-13]|nr:IS200/IS605 family element transposase accessory protein TnpB [Microcystis aeruginosa LG13-13]
MFVLEFKVKAKTQQYQAIDDAIRTAQFIRNKCVRLWMDTKGTGKNDLYRYSKELAQDFKFADELNSTARQASAERAWSSISRFYDNCKRKVSGKKGYPQFKKSRSVEYKQSGWKLLSPKTVKFTDKKNIGVLKLVGTWDLGYFQESDIKRVRLIRRADGYYCQFVLSCDVKEDVKPSGRQRQDFAVKLARCVVHSSDVIAYEDLRVKNLVKNHCLAKSINDAAWYQFREWIEYFGVKFGKITIAVSPNYTSQNCSNCGETVKKSLSTRTHQCKCGCVLDRDENAAINILKRGLSTVGHTGTFGLDPINAWGENTSTFSEAILSKQVISVNQESPSL